MSIETSDSSAVLTSQKDSKDSLAGDKFKSNDAEIAALAKTNKTKGEPKLAAFR